MAAARAVQAASSASEGRPWLTGALPGTSRLALASRATTAPPSSTASAACGCPAPAPGTVSLTRAGRTGPGGESRGLIPAVPGGRLARPLARPAVGTAVPPVTARDPAPGPQPHPAATGPPTSPSAYAAPGVPAAHRPGVRLLGWRAGGGLRLWLLPVDGGVPLPLNGGVTRYGYQPLPFARGVGGRCWSNAARHGWPSTRALARASGTPRMSRLVIVAARAPSVPFERPLSAMVNTAA